MTECEEIAAGIASILRRRRTMPKTMGEARDTVRRLLAWDEAETVIDNVASALFQLGKNERGS